MPTAFAFIVFFLVLAVLAALSAITASIRQSIRRRQITVRIAPLPDQTAATPGSVLPTPTGEKPLPGIRLLGCFFSLASLEELLIAADVRLAPDRFLLATVAGGVLVLVAVYALSGNILLALGAMALVGSLPFLVLLHRKRKKQQVLADQLPEALDMIVRALRVGQSVDNALLEVSRSCPPPLGPEIRLIYEEVSLGLPFIAALRNFEARFARLADVKLMITAFVIQHETGGNLTRILDNLSDLIRKRGILRRQIRSLTAEGRSSALILGILPLAVGLFFWLVRPDYLRMLFVHPAGRKMLLVAGMLELLGFLIMRILTRINP